MKQLSFIFMLIPLAMIPLAYSQSYYDGNLPPINDCDYTLDPDCQPPLTTIELDIFIKLDELSDRIDTLEEENIQLEVKLAWERDYVTIEPYIIQGYGSGDGLPRSNTESLVSIYDGTISLEFAWNAMYIEVNRNVEYLESNDISSYTPTQLENYYSALEENTILRDFFEERRDNTIDYPY